MRYSTGTEWCLTCNSAVRRVEPKGCLFFFLISIIATGLIIACDLAVRQVSPHAGLWEWMSPGFYGIFHQFHDFGLIWRFILGASIAAIIAGLVIRKVFRIDPGRDAYLACGCGRRS